VKGRERLLLADEDKTANKSSNNGRKHTHTHVRWDEERKRTPSDNGGISLGRSLRSSFRKAKKCLS